MASAPLTGLPAASSVAATDICYVVTTPGGTPASKKATAALLVLGGLVQPAAGAGVGGTDMLVKAQNAGAAGGNGGKILLVPGAGSGGANGTLDFYASDGTTLIGRMSNDGTNSIFTVTGGNINYVKATLFQGNSTDLNLATNFSHLTLSGFSGNVGINFANPSITPPQITSDQNDYQPDATLGGPSWLVRLDADATPRNITGLTWQRGGNCASQFHWIYNVGTGTIVLKNQNAGSTAANRFLCELGADITLTTLKGAFVIYDDVATRWRASAI